jgi:hypothetical protein
MNKMRQSCTNAKALIYALFALGASSLLGQTAAPSKAEGPPDPKEIFSPKAPVCKYLEVTVSPKKPEFFFGQEPEFRVAIKNISHIELDLSGDALGEVIFNPYMVVCVVGEDGRQVRSLGQDWFVPERHKMLAPGSALTFSHPQPPKPGEVPKATYRLRPDVLLPGRYYVFVNFWVLADGENQRAISSASAFDVKGDGSRDVEIARDLQTGRTLPEGFEFRLEQQGGDRVRVIATNRSKRDVFLGNHWGWWRKYPGKAETEEKTGPRPQARIVVPAGREVVLQTVAIGSGQIKGEYQIQFRYYNGDWRPVAKSNIVRSDLRR